MFFIMGISQGQKKLDFDQLVVCGRCGRYGHLEVYMVYSYLSLIFIPLFKWGRHYYIRTSCCEASVEIDAELGRKIERGEIKSLPETIIPDSGQYGLSRKKRCAFCGFETEEDYQFCPKCGKEF